MSPPRLSLYLYLRNNMYVVVWYPFFHCWPTFRPCSLTYPKPPYTRSRIEDGRHWWLMSIFYNFKIISYRYRPTYFVRKGGLILWVYNISLTWYKYINVHIYHLPEYKTPDSILRFYTHASFPHALSKQSTSTWSHPISLYNVDIDLQMLLSHVSFFLSQPLLDNNHLQLQ